MPHEQGHIERKITSTGEDITDLSSEERSLKLKQANCESKGGRWDAERKVCILPGQDDTTPKTETATPPPGTIEVGKFGNKEQVILPDGRLLTGLNKKDVEDLRRQTAEETARLEGTAPIGTAQAEADKARQLQELQETGAPIRRELDPTLTSGESFPVVGPLLAKARKALGLSAKSNSVLDLITGKAGDEEFPDLQPEELKTAILTEIERREIEAGLTDSEKFGSFVESVPAGELAKYIPGFGDAEKPSDNVQTILKSLRQLNTRATDIQTKIVTGRLSPRAGTRRLDIIEEELQKGESRMKLLIQNSPELKFNSDGVNFIEGKILATRERVFDGRLAVIEGPTRDPTTLEILGDAQASIATEDLDIPGL